MFSENLKNLRKQKGMSQEVLAQQLNVVRQTISKWEKGLSVPDAEMLSRIAELFEVSESDLLGSKIETNLDQNEISVQLALLNEQIALERKFRKSIIKYLKIAVIVVALAFVGLYVHSIFAKLTTRTVTGYLDGQTYTYEVTYWPDLTIFKESSDAYIDEEIFRNNTDRDISEKVNLITNYFSNHGGSSESVTKGYFANGGSIKYTEDASGTGQWEVN